MTLLSFQGSVTGSDRDDIAFRSSIGSVAEAIVTYKQSGPACSDCRYPAAVLALSLPGAPGPPYWEHRCARAIDHSNRRLESNKQLEITSCSYLNYNLLNHWQHLFHLRLWTDGHYYVKPPRRATCYQLEEHYYVMYVVSLWLGGSTSI